MLRNFISKLLEPRHYWRTVGFDELSELYTAQLLRSLGISLIGLFTPIYLYKIGYSLSSIALFHVFWFLFRPIFDLLSAHIVARIGPKHTMLLSSFVHITYLGLVMTLQDLRWPLILVASLGSFAYGLHMLAVAVDFSKVKHANHGGKELGYLDSMQKIGGILGPLVGGLIANYADPRYTVALAMLVLLLSAIPLFLSSEAVMVKQHIVFKGLPIREHLRDYISVVPATIENTVSLIVWPLYTAIFLLGDNTFAKLGLIAALSTAFSLLVVRKIGGLIDKRRGRELLHVSLVLNAFIHLLRPLARSTVGVLGINMANEPVTAGYRMPYLKGIYDTADSVPGYRIAYLTSLSIVDSFARLGLWVFVFIGFYVFEAKSTLQVTFLVASLCSFGVMVERFRALDTN
ncbi:MAG TPA: hypothetical protein PLW46_00225 [Acinetobacter johnsonii]|nr:hypothetical protein [Acinetobacter johnsonii]